MLRTAEAGKNTGGPWGEGYPGLLLEGGHDDE